MNKKREREIIRYCYDQSYAQDLIVLVVDELLHGPKTDKKINTLQS